MIIYHLSILYTSLNTVLHPLKTFPPKRCNSSDRTAITTLQVYRHCLVCMFQTRVAGTEYLFVKHHGLKAETFSNVVKYNMLKQ